MSLYGPGKRAVSMKIRNTPNGKPYTPFLKGKIHKDDYSGLPLSHNLHMCKEIPCFVKEIISELPSVRKPTARGKDILYEEKSTDNEVRVLLKKDDKTPTIMSQILTTSESVKNTGLKFKRNSNKSLLNQNIILISTKRRASDIPSNRQTYSKLADQLTRSNIIKIKSRGNSSGNIQIGRNEMEECHLNKKINSNDQFTKNCQQTVYTKTKTTKDSIMNIGRRKCGSISCYMKENSEIETPEEQHMFFVSLYQNNKHLALKFDLEQEEIDEELI